MSLQALPDTELFALLLRGDETAFKALYQSYAPRLAAYAESRLASLEEARDIVQDIFVHLWTHRASISPAHSAQAYLFAATRHRIIDHIRRNATRREYAERIRAFTGSEAPSPEAEQDARELQRYLEQVVAQLPPATRNIFELSRNEQLTVVEIAGRLDLSEQTVKNQLHRALSRLRLFKDRLASFLW